MSCSGLKSLVGSPPAMSERAEFSEFDRIGVGHELSCK
jgi:hypothetical protein